MLASVLWLNLLSAIVVINPDYHQSNQHWLTGDKVLICTVHGLQWISVSELTTQQDEPGRAHWQNQCPLLSPLQPLSPDLDPFQHVILIAIAIFAGIRVTSRVWANNKLYTLFGPKQSPPEFSNF
ncbi:hypothetical protein EA58_20165 [Photobacterium galatheae]|uniref:Uncharacterized protein n=2 Tax=Photobacterium galatheae TaxID=1654360 RepID=A0A066RQ22_9GAMM|nr:hypothetical protein EA58_20165 [Photobacterium galatheae]